MARSIPAEIRASLAAPLKRLEGLDPFDLLRRSVAANEELLAAQSRIATMRRAAVRQLRAEGYTFREIAEPLGLKPQRIHQIESGYDRSEKQERARSVGAHKKGG